MSTMSVKQYAIAELILFGERFVVDSALAEIIQNTLATGSDRF